MTFRPNERDKGMQVYSGVYISRYTTSLEELARIDRVVRLRQHMSTGNTAPP